jgi:CRISPR system Cascade subunit CasC
MFASACFYKYFSINWETLVHNLEGFGADHEKLAAHTVGAFLHAAALVSPTGKQNSFAAHNPPDGMLIEIRNSPVSYANAFAKPASQGERDIILQSIAQLGQYVHDLDAGYGKPRQRFWFSPNLRWQLAAQVKADRDGETEQKQATLTEKENSVKSLDELVRCVIRALPGKFDWDDVQRVVVNSEVAA